jgi:hypothetical protein
LWKIAGASELGARRVALRQAATTSGLAGDFHMRGQTPAVENAG